MANGLRVRARKRVLCPHCKESVSHDTYYRHRERFYDPQNDQWTGGLERHAAGAPTSGDCDSSSSDEIDDLSTRSESPLQSLEGFWTTLLKNMTSVTSYVILQEDLDSCM